MIRKKSGVPLLYVAAVILAVAGAVVAANSHAQEPGQGAIAKSIGTIKTISGNTLTLAVSGSPDVTVTVLPAARVLRLAPGDKDLKSATPLQLTDLQVGDRIRARGQGASDGKSINALEILVFTSSAVNAGPIRCGRIGRSAASEALSHRWMLLREP